MPRPDLPLVAGIELGGTKAIALLARDRDIVAQTQVPTTTPDETLAALAGQLALWSRLHGTLAAIGVASFGPIGLDRARPDYGHITRTPKPGWSGTDVAGYFARAFDLPVAFDTDVAGAALAEYNWGSGKDCDVLVYITVGTGIGAGMLVNGEPVHGLLHPEFGHIRVRRVPDDTFAGTCPFHGDCLEGLASGPAITARAGQPGNALADDHPVMMNVVHELAEAAAQLVLTVSPRRILIGGGVVQHRPPIFPGLRRRIAELLAGYLEPVDEATLADTIQPPGLGAMAGPLGAAALATRWIRP